MWIYFFVLQVIDYVMVGIEEIFGEYGENYLRVSVYIECYFIVRNREEIILCLLLDDFVFFIKKKRNIIVLIL